MDKCKLCNKQTDRVILCPIIKCNVCFECCFAISSGREAIIDEVRDKYKIDRDSILSECDRCISDRPIPGLEEENERDREMGQMDEEQKKMEISIELEKEKKEDNKKGNLFEMLKKESMKQKEEKGEFSEKRKEEEISRIEEEAKKVAEEKKQEEIRRKEEEAKKVAEEKKEEEIRRKEEEAKKVAEEKKEEEIKKKEEKKIAEEFKEKKMHKKKEKGFDQFKHGGENILIVDNDPQSMGFLSDILRKKGCVVSCVSTREKAIEKVSKTLFNVIVVDYQLSDGDGLSTIKELRDIDKDVYFIILIDAFSKEKLEGEIRDYTNACLVKPVSASQLEEAIGKAIEREDEISEEIVSIEAKENLEQITKEFLKTSGNRYHIIREIGIGGFASVYKAWAINLEKFVAVKKIHKSFSQEARFLDMFRDEAVNSSKLEHENVVRVIDFLKTVNNIYYIIMEYVKGCNLFDLLEKCQKQDKKISFDLAAHTISEVLKGLKYAHSKVDEITGEPLGIVHRDISPGNIMIYFDGRIKITDFGIAKATTRYIAKAKKGALRGKVAYMSPEQATGDVELDYRSDIYSIGIVLYRLLTGQWPFEGTTDYDIWEKVKKGKVNLQLLKDVGVPDNLTRIVTKSLKKDREKRYQHDEDVFVDLQEYLHKRKKYSHMLQGEFREFIHENLKREIKKEEENSKKESNRSRRAAIEQETTVKKEVEVNDLPAKEKPSFVLPEIEEIKETQKEIKLEKSEGEKKIKKKVERKKVEVEGEAREKTVFDFVLDTANRYKKMIIRVSLGLLIGVIGFVALDTFQHWTSLGTKIYNFFWPPTLSIDTLPSGASVSLVNDNMKNVLKKNAFSPVYISKILPGNYTLILKKEGYNDIERRITVFGIEKGKQDIKLDGVDTADKDKKNKMNLIAIPFEIGLEISSLPEGAEIYIDGKKLPEKTPLIQNIKVGEHTVKLVMDGFNDLGNIEKVTMRGQCNINLVKDASDQEGIDRRYWDINSSVIDDGLLNYTLLGTFWKEISLDSSPPGAAIYVDDSKTAWGTTPQKISIKIGEYKIKLEKPDFSPWAGTIKVNAETEVSINPVLKKWVYFYAYGKGNNKKDINASVYIKGTKINGKKTPFKYPLLIKGYDVTFKKLPKYKSRSFKIDINDKKVVKAILKPQPILLKVVVKDIANEYDIHNAYILLNNKWVGQTNEKGVWKKILKAGKYKIKVGKQKEYEAVEVTKALNWGDKEVKIDVFLAVIFKNKEKLLEKGIAYYKKGKWVKASKTLNKLLKFNPTNKKALKYLAKVNREIAKKEAEEIKRKCKVLSSQAKEDFKDKRWLTAYDKYSQILSLGPDDKKIVNDSKRYVTYIDKIMDNIAQGVKPVDRSRDLFYAIGFCYYREGDFKRAISEWERVLSLDSGDTEIKEFIKKVKRKM